MSHPSLPHRRLAGLLVLLGLLAGCGSSDPAVLTDEGWTAYNSGDRAVAADKFEDALKAIGEDKSHPSYVRARMGLIQSIAGSNAKRAREDFLALAAERPNDIDDADFSKMANELYEGDPAEAIALAQRGQELYPESPHLAKLVQDLGDKAAAEGDSDALQSLKGLGYVGD